MLNLINPSGFYVDPDFPLRLPFSAESPERKRHKKSACIVMQAPLSVTPEGLEPSTQ